MTGIDALLWSSAAFLVHPSPPKSLTIHLDGDPWFRATPFVLTNPIVESGLLTCRATAEFLGLRRSRKSGRVVERTGKAEDTDVVIEDLGFARVPLTALGKKHPDWPTPMPRESIATVIDLANRNVAHFTTAHPARRAARRVYVAAERLEWLVDEYVYRRNGLSVPDYKQWTRGLITPKES
jgi:hypothetical protein